MPSLQPVTKYLRVGAAAYDVEVFFSSAAVDDDKSQRLNSQLANPRRRFDIIPICDARPLPDGPCELDATSLARTFSADVQDDRPYLFIDFLARPRQSRRRRRVSIQATRISIFSAVTTQAHRDNPCKVRCQVSIKLHLFECLHTCNYLQIHGGSSARRHGGVGNDDIEVFLMRQHCPRRTVKTCISSPLVAADGSGYCYMDDDEFSEMAGESYFQDFAADKCWFVDPWTRDACVAVSGCDWLERWGFEDGYCDVSKESMKKILSDTGAPPGVSSYFNKWWHDACWYLTNSTCTTVTGCVLNNRDYCEPGPAKMAVCDSIDRAP